MKNEVIEKEEAEAQADFYIHRCDRPGCRHKETRHYNFEGACLVTGCDCPAYREPKI